MGRFRKNLNLLNLEESTFNISLLNATFVMTQLAGARQERPSHILALAWLPLILLLFLCVLFETNRVLLIFLKEFSCVKMLLMLNVTF